MTSYRSTKAFHFRWQARYIIASFQSAPPIDLTKGFNHPHRTQAFPFVFIGKPVQVIALIVSASFNSTVILQTKETKDFVVRTAFSSNFFLYLFLGFG